MERPENHYRCSMKIVHKHGFTKDTLTKNMDQTFGFPTQLKKIITVGMYITSQAGILTSGSKMLRGSRMLKKMKLKNMDTIRRAMKKS